MSLSAARRHLSDVSPGVWAVVVMLGGILVVGTYLQPIFRVPDERYHVDMVLTAMDGAGWPAVQERTLSPQVAAAGRLARQDRSDGALALPAAGPGDGPACRPGGPRPDCTHKPTFDELARTYDFTGPVNRMTQHPPAYYLVTGQAISTVTALTVREVPYDGQVWLYRLVGALLVLPLPLFVSRGMLLTGARPALRVAAAALPILLVGLTLRNAVVVNNDNLLVPASTGVVFLLLLMGLRGVTRARLAWLGALLGLALITKGTALLTAAAIPFSLLLLVPQAMPRRDRVRSAVRATTVVGVAAAIFGGWWPLRNLVMYGSLQPAGMRRGDAGPEFIPSFVDWAQTFGSGIVRTGLGRTGSQLLNEPALLLVTAGISVALIVLGVRVVGWRVALAVNLPLIATLVGWSANSYMAYTRTGVAAALNMRYYYPVMLGIFILVGCGVRVVADRVPRIPPAVWSGGALGLGLLVTTREVRFLLGSQWSGGEGIGAGLDALASWAPAPVALMYVGAGLAVMAAIAAVALVSLPTTQRTSPFVPQHSLRP